MLMAYWAWRVSVATIRFRCFLAIQCGAKAEYHP